MGRPALINRTGRFSNSAEITDLRQTGKGISERIVTYLLSPYETFENTGDQEGGLLDIIQNLLLLKA